MTYTVEKDGELWLILKSGAPHITVKDEPTASTLAAILNAFAEAKLQDGRTDGINARRSGRDDPELSAERV